MSEHTALGFSQKLTYPLGQLAVSLSPALISTWLIYFYAGRTGAGGAPLILVSALAMSLAGLIPRCIEAFAEPVVGHLSDKLNTRWGRRIPWVVVGTPLLAVCSVLIWFPPDPEGQGRALVSVLGLDLTPNFLWLLGAHTAFWVLYTAVAAPYLSLLPELTSDGKERIQLSEYMAYSDVAGTVLGSLGLGWLLDVYSGGFHRWGLRLSNGFEVAGVLIGVIFTGSFFASISRVKERPYSAAKAVHFSFVESVVETFKNRAFTPYVASSAALRMGMDIVLASIPFLVSRILGLSEGLAGVLQGVIVLGAAFLFPLVSRLATRRGKKAVFSLGQLWFAGCLLGLTTLVHFPFFGWPIAALAGALGHPLAPNEVSFAHALVTMGLCAFSISVIFVLQRPLLNDVMDHDERLTGYRREAMYNGMEGLISRPASGLAYFIVPLLNEYLGASVERPYGVLAAPLVAGLIIFAGWWSFRRYPIEA